MKKKNNLMKKTCLTLVAVIIALVLVAGTYAKYISSATGSSMATVAKWDIKAGQRGNELSITGDNATVAFNLFETILNEDGTAETDVAEDKIAPGTSGGFELSVKNDSEVNAEYTVNFNVSNQNIPLEYRVNGGDWSSSLAGVAATALDMNESDIAKVEWRWAYETPNGDKVDTDLGITPEDVEVTATLVVSQVN